MRLSEMTNRISAMGRAAVLVVVALAAGALTFAWLKPHYPREPVPTLTLLVTNQVRTGDVLYAREGRELGHVLAVDKWCEFDDGTVR